jgi:hypothetical protein
MIHVVVMKCLMIPFSILVDLPLLIYILSFCEGVKSQKFQNCGVGVRGFVYQIHSPRSKSLSCSWIFTLTLCAVTVFYCGWFWRISTHGTEVILCWWECIFFGFFTFCLSTLCLSSYPSASLYVTLLEFNFLSEMPRHSIPIWSTSPTAFCCPGGM